MESFKVKVAALSDIRKLTGWGFKEFEFSGEHATVEELLKSVKTKEGDSLYDRLVLTGDYKSKYVIILNGRRVGCENGLNQKLEPGDEVVSMELIRFVAGG